MCLSVNLVCTGCGAPLQMDEENQRGYVTGSAFLREQPLCQRCYRLIHYGQFSPGNVTEEEYRSSVMRSLSRPSLVLYVIDLFDLAGSLVRGLAGTLRGNEVWVVGNKVDLLARELSRERLSNWLVREARRNGLEATRVVLLSARSEEGLDGLWRELLAHSRGRQVVTVGMANVGKSSLLNRLLAKSGQLDGQALTTSPYPGTTLSGMSVKLGGSGMVLADTPGLLGKYRLQDRVCRDSLKWIIPEERVRPRIYQLQPDQTLFLGGLARLDFIAGQPQPFVIYAANQLTVHRTKLDHADELYHRQLGLILNPPCSDCDASLRELRSKNVSFEDGKPVDLVIPGLGWVRLSGRRVKLRIHLPSGIEVSVRPALGGRFGSADKKVSRGQSRVR